MSEDFEVVAGPPLFIKKRVRWRTPCTCPNPKCEKQAHESETFYKNSRGWRIFCAHCGAVKHSEAQYNI